MSIFKLSNGAARMLSLRMTSNKTDLISSVNLHTSQSFLIDRRKDKAVAQHLHYQDHEKTMRHRNLPIVECPDYSYVDGRPTELASNQKERQKKNYAMAKQVVQLLDEIKLAQQQLKINQQEISSSQQQRKDSALLEKGRQTY
ncbi:unnamed protein product [Lymnaea stagnalis]|uniref:Large ribosomal subunit protein mL52 n=1 Tax=Lymnaea stagnalis TaxID=6523 RepID=A0AAV2I2P8_LYMST